MGANIDSKIKTATKWSVTTELAAKLISPISNMILARLLSPEAFGVIATVTMIISFADMFTDAGFQKYLVQHDFESEQDLLESTNVAFWTNLLISIILWMSIAINRDFIARIVGNPGLGNVILIACISLPLTSFSSIQMALFRRQFDFKTLFAVRIVAILIPIFVTVPLAFIFRSYWALVIGTIAVNFSNAIILTIKSSWKPTLEYKFSVLKEMFSFSGWTLIEQISIWLTNYIGTFIVGSLLATYYVGLYKTSMTTVNQITALITSATTPVIFAALSRCQENEEEFWRVFFEFQKNVSIFVIPLGAGIFLYRDLITTILLGKQWEQASGFIGLWGLMSSITIVFSHFSSEVYRAKGKPRLSFWVQCAHLVVLIPALYISAKFGFESLYITRSLVRFEIIFINLVVMASIFGISPVKQVINCMPEIISTVIMAVVAFLLQKNTVTILGEFISVGICVVIYFSILLVFPVERARCFAVIKGYWKAGHKHK